jgi:ABC-type proline/glycine betaine transport system permease subunit
MVRYAVANTPYYKEFEIVLPYQDKDNILKILCQHLKIKFFAVFFALIVALWGNVRIRISRIKGCTG